MALRTNPTLIGVLTFPSPSGAFVYLVCFVVKSSVGEPRNTRTTRKRNLFKEELFFTEDNEDNQQFQSRCAPLPPVQARSFRTKEIGQAPDHHSLPRLSRNSIAQTMQRRHAPGISV